MCGRFTLRASPEQLGLAFGVAPPQEVAPRYNVAPTQPVAIVRPDSATGKRVWTYALWGLIPSWAKDPTIGGRLINARSETAAEKPSFRGAFKYRRCLVPVDGFYEWQKVGKGKQPYFIHMQDDAPFAVAGLWEHWIGPDGSEIESCTLLTTEPNGLMQPLHNRMPVILAAADYDRWLTTDSRDVAHLRDLLRPYPADSMAAYPVSTLVNNGRHEAPGCIDPLR